MLQNMVKYMIKNDCTDEFSEKLMKHVHIVVIICYTKAIKQT